MNAVAEKTLAQYGFNPFEALSIQQFSPDQRRIYLQQELETYVNHTLEDCAVSLPYFYQRAPTGEILSYPSQIPVTIDKEERGGLFQIGVDKSVDAVMQNPQRLVFLYSPPGPVVFDNNPDNKFRLLKPYDRGQLYIMYFDGQKINNVSVMVSTKTGEEWLRKVLGNEYEQAEEKPDEISRISHFITHPQLSGYDIDQFLNIPWPDADKDIFINRSGQHFTLAQTLNLIRDSFAGKLKPAINTFDKTIAAMHKYALTESFINQLYLSAINAYMEQNKMTTLALGGGCGGTVVSRSPFGTSVTELINNLSTPFRMMTQSETHWDYHDGECVVCKQKSQVGPCNICQNCEKTFD